MRKLLPLAEAACVLCCCLLALLLAGQWLHLSHPAARGSVNSTTDDATNLRLLSQAVLQYTQDNDETLPPMQNAQVFQAAVRPYAVSAAAFYCPETGLPYTPNAALSGKFLTSLSGDTDTIELARDSQPHADGLYTVLFVDGTVKHGDQIVGDPNDIVVSRAKQLALATTQYAQDYDETLPPMHTPEEFQAALAPYTHSHVVFYAPNGRPFLPNADLSGVSLASIADPSSTLLLTDQAPYVSGAQTVAYVDGTVKHGGQIAGDPNDLVVGRAKQLALATTQYTQDNDEILPPMQTPEEFQTALSPYVRSRAAFYAPNGKPFLPNADLSGVSLGSIAEPASTLLLMDQEPYVSGALTRAYVDGHVKHYPLFYKHALWTNTDGTTAVWNYVPADGTFSQHAYGPYPGWTAKAVADGGTDGKTRVLWTNTDGTMSLWSLDSASGSFTQHTFGPYPGWNASAISVAPDNTTHIVWTNANGAVSIWNYSIVTGSFTQNTYGPYPGWSAEAVSDGPDSKTRLLWNNTNGTMSLWSLNNSTKQFSHHEFGPYPGWTAKTVSVAPDNTTHIVWNKSDGTASVWNYSTDTGGFTLNTYGPYPGWSAGPVADTAGKTALLWTNTDGTASFWNLDNGAGSFTQNSFGPYPGWSAIGLSAAL